MVFGVSVIIAVPTNSEPRYFTMLNLTGIEATLVNATFSELARRLGSPRQKHSTCPLMSVSAFQPTAPRSTTGVLRPAGGPCSRSSSAPRTPAVGSPQTGQTVRQVRLSDKADPPQIGQTLRQVRLSLRQVRPLPQTGQTPSVTPSDRSDPSLRQVRPSDKSDSLRQVRPSDRSDSLL